MKTGRTARNLVQDWRRLQCHQQVLVIETAIRDKSEANRLRRLANRHAEFLGGKLDEILAIQLRTEPGMRLRILDHSLSKKFRYEEGLVSVGELMRAKMINFVLRSIENYASCNLAIMSEWTLEPPTICKHVGVTGCSAAHCQHIVWWGVLVSRDDVNYRLRKKK
jgi:hypothetical protein